MDTKTTFYIVRHGETKFNVGGIVQGHTDSPLTATGIEQAKALGEALKDIHFDAVFTSDLLRTQRTAELMLLDRQLVINTSKLLRERNYGKFDGQPAQMFRDENKEIFEKMKSFDDAEHHDFKFHPTVESDNETSSRLLLFLREAAVTYPGKTILIVTHGGIIRVFLLKIGWATYKELPGGSVGNTAYIKVVSDGTDFSIEGTAGITKTER